MKHFHFSTALCLLVLFIGLPQVNAVSGSKGTPHTREYFYVGGNYITAEDGTHFWENQMYVEELTPVGGSKKPYPLVFIHGLGQTGTNFLNTPDNRPGWSSYFLARGYTIYIVDTPARARSPWFSFTNQTLVPFTAEVIQRRFTAPEKYNTYPSAHLHTQWPGNGTIGDPVFDAFFESNVPSILAAVTSETLVQHAGTALLDRIDKKVILIAHSEGGKAPWLIADLRPKLVKSIVAIEPAGPPFIEPPLNGGVPARAWGAVSIPITYDPPVTDPSQIKTTVIVSNFTDVDNCTIQDASKGKPRVLKNLAMIDRVLILTSQASWHTGYDWCTTLFLKQAGVNAEQIKLQDVGIKGNGHMMFMEKNSDDVAEVVRNWIEGSKRG